MAPHEESHGAATTGGSSTPEFEAVLESLLDERRRGVHSGLEECIALYPEFAGKIREVFPVLDLMAQAASLLGPRAAAMDTADPAGLRASVTGELGDFRILREIGRGGMGIVFEAEQPALGRRVALKVLTSQGSLDAQQIERFHREAKAAARLHHTNIVPVFGVGEDGGTHYYAMQYIEGRSLDRVIAEIREAQDGIRLVAGNGQAAVATTTAVLAVHPPLPRAAAGATPEGDGERPDLSPPAVPSSGPARRSFYHAAARICMQAAGALAHAHAQGVVHRDIKPSNLILDKQGTVWVSDFGLAQAAGSDGLTRSGDVVGTLRYMAPERFDGRGDARVDIYALGLTLYELLTLEPAFAESDKGRLMRRICDQEPAAPRCHDRSIPADLETIILKAIAKDPDHRYDTAEQFADDLGRFLRGEPVQARPLGVPSRVWRWCRRKPAMAGLTGAVLGLAAVVAVVSAAAYLKTARARDQEAAQRRQADTNLYSSLVREARATRLARQAGFRDECLRLLDDARRVETTAVDIGDLRQEAVLCLGDPMGLEPAYLDLPGRLRALHIDRGSTRIVFGTEEGGVFLADSAAPDERQEVTRRRGPVTAVFLSQDGEVLASADQQGVVELRRARPGSGWEPVQEIATGMAVGRLDLDPERTVLVARGAQGFKAYDFTGGRPAWTATGGDSPLRGSSFSPDGRLIASGHLGRESGILVWRRSDGVLVRKLASTLVYPYATAFSADSSLLAGGFDDGIEVYETKTFTRIQALRSTWVEWLDFHPQTALLAYRAADWIHVWNPTANQEAERLRHAYVQSARLRGGFGDQGMTLLSPEPGRLRVWRLFATPERRTLLGHEIGVPGIAFSPDGRRLATAGKDRSVRLWDGVTGAAAGVLAGFRGPVQTVGFSPDGELLAAGDWAGDLQLWRVASRLQLATWDPQLGDIWRVAFSGDGALLAACGNGGLHLWRTRDLLDTSGREPLSCLSRREVREVAFSREPARPILAWVEDRAVLARDLDADVDLPLAAPELLDNIGCLAFLPGGKLAFINSRGAPEVWDLRGGKRLHGTSTTGPFAHSQLSVSGDGALLAGLTVDSTLSIWEVRAERRIVNLPNERAGIWNLAWSPVGARLAIGLNDGGVFLWDLPEVRRQLGRHGLDWDDAGAAGAGAEEPSR